VDAADRVDGGHRAERRRHGADAIDVTPRERRDIPWIVAAGVLACLLVLLMLSWQAG
jgi:hypothetical protein